MSDPPPSGAAPPAPPRAASPLRTALRWLAAIPSGLLIGLVRLYQVFLSPFLGRQCRFHPTCSHYMIGAIRKYGPLSGVVRGLWRICRCHPFSPGGYDPP